MFYQRLVARTDESRKIIFSILFFLFHLFHPSFSSLFYHYIIFDCSKICRSSLRVISHLGSSVCYDDSIATLRNKFYLTQQFLPAFTPLNETLALFNRAQTAQMTEKATAVLDHALQLSVLWRSGLPPWRIAPKKTLRGLRQLLFYKGCRAARLRRSDILKAAFKKNADANFDTCPSQQSLAASYGSGS